MGMEFHYILFLHLSKQDGVQFIQWHCGTHAVCYHNLEYFGISKTLTCDSLYRREIEYLVCPDRSDSVVCNNSRFHRGQPSEVEECSEGSQIASVVCSETGTGRADIQVPIFIQESLLY